MAAALAPAQLLREAWCCCVLGMFAGAGRELLPAKGRAAFAPDMLLVGVLLVLLQSYAAAYGGTGVLRWYMLLGGALGALLAHAALAAPLRAARRAAAFAAALPLRFLRRRVLLPLQKRRVWRRERAKERKNKKLIAKKCKKSLQKHRHLLYNSNM